MDAAPPPPAEPHVDAAPASAARLLHLAALAAELGRGEQAVAFARRATAAPDAGPQAWVELGRALERAGRTGEAGAAWRAGCARFPDDVLLHYDLGCAYVALGRPGDATAPLKRAVRLAPGDAGVRGALGHALLRAGRAAAAVEELERAAGLDPYDAAVASNLGNALVAAGRPEEGVRVLAAACDRYPDDGGLWNNLGVALRAAGRGDEAERALRRAVRAAPEGPHAHANLGNHLLERGDAAGAADSIERALALDPTPARWHANLGRARFEARELDAAERGYRRALELDPRLADVHNNLGALLEARGELDAAEGAYRRALELDPRLARAWYNLARSGRAGDTAGVERALARPGLGPCEESDLAFALGLLHDRDGRVDEAFAAFERANAARRRAGLAFDPAAHAARHEALLVAFASAPAPHAGADPSERPVLVVGLPRSGTSLVEAILARHPRVLALGEREDLPRLVRALERETGVGYPACLAAAPAATVRERLREYLAPIDPRGDRPGALRATDKLPGNLEHLGLVAALLPNARVVCCRRDPRDVCLSAWMQSFAGPRLPWTYDLAHLGRVARDAGRLMAHWQRVLPLRMLTVDYERLVTEPEPEARRLVRFLDLEWDARCLEPQRAPPVLTASAWQVRRPITASSVGRWKAYERHLGPLLAALQSP